jgi:hypothetical protein
MCDLLVRCTWPLALMVSTRTNQYRNASVAKKYWPRMQE